MSEHVPRVLIVDDEQGVGFVFSRAMTEQGYRPLWVATAAACLEEVARQEPDAVLLDMMLPDADGVTVLSALRKEHPDVPVIMVTGQGSRSLAAQAMELGAYDYFSKPCELSDLRAVVRRAVEKRALTREIVTLKESAERPCRFDGIIGESRVLKDVLNVVAKVAGTEVNVLITGPSGTGKELVARAIHGNSPRSDQPFVSMNCAAIPQDLIEAELFGHERGAFTDAKQRRAGRFELADGGTLFLDEIGDMSLPAQAKLVRVLQEREFERVGGEKTVRVDVRVLAATNQDLSRAIREKRFREDLYYRLCVVAINLPALAQRVSDIPLLVEHFVGKHKGTGAGGRRSVSPEAMAALSRYEWPGNIRELENCIQRALVLSDDRIEVAHLPPHVQASAGRRQGASGRAGNLAEAMAAVEKGLIEEALAESGGVPARAAEALGVSERTLWYKLKRYGIRLRAFQSADAALPRPAGAAGDGPPDAVEELTEA
jgi:DNA-binding NtrC family response regulator